MKNLLRKLNAMSTQSEDNNLEGSTNSSSKGKKIISSSLWSSSAHPSLSKSSYSEQNKPSSTLAGWFHSVTNRKSLSLSSPSSNAKKAGGVGKMERAESSSSGGATDSALDGPRCGGGGGGSEASNTKDRGGGDTDEEYQIQLAMELSAKEDPEAVQIEAVKQISLGSHPPESAPAEVVAYRYWNYNCLSYDDKILDGFYDLYGICSEFPSPKMPSLIDLQGTAISEGMSWEVVLVNKAADSNLVKLEQRALVLAVKAKSESLLPVNIEFVQQLAVLVASYMGGPVGDPESMLRAWKSLSYSLKSTLGSMVLPLGSLTIGLARHRALLFKVLADSVNVPCQLVKGHQYTGSDEVAMNIVKLDDGREFIVDLMSDPGALIPYEVVGTHVEYEDSLSSRSLLSRDVDSSTVGTSSSGAISSCEELSGSDFLDRRNRWLKRQPLGAIDSRDVSEPLVSISSLRLGTGIEEPKVGAYSHGIYPKLERLPGPDISAKPSYAFSHARSPSWTEGVSSPAVRKMKAKDVSQYMMDAAKENPHLAQKLHDVLLESGVVAPPNLFTGVYSTHSETVTDSNQQAAEEKDEVGRDGDKSVTSEAHHEPASSFLPPLPPRPTVFPQLEYPKRDESSMAPSTSGMGELSKLSLPPQSDPPHVKFGKNVPVAAAAAAAAAVVASSVVAAVAKSTADSTIANPVAAAATATAAAVVATTAAVGKQLDHFEAPHSPGRRSYGDGESGGLGSQGGSDHRRESDLGTSLEGERTSDRSVGTDSGRSEAQLEDVADCEIPWEEITLGERIGLGSYGEVYKGDWHGTEVAIKRFLDQDMWGESLEEFKSEVRIMKRLRHPNVVLFMGAITRPPNLSIITEFLPRGSLYRLLHRPNNQLDERRCLRMAYDAARGMNYLHNSSPVIVHRDLKSPNLLVDRNWVVKVCDFGLSKIKHSTFLSSRSTAGTAEWMAPEVLRNEPSNEKCDVYSYGVILWELCTMQQPWGGMNPMQVVGAVGFQHRRLDIPSDVDPVIADIIRKCWETDPRLRPSFAEIMTALKPFQKPVTASHLSRPSLRGSERDPAQ